MNMKRFAFVSVIALVALFVNTFSAAAYSAELSEITSCNQLAASVDIPARHVDYMRMSSPVPCPVVAGTSTVLIPNTGAGASPDRYTAFKDMQAYLFSGDYVQAQAITRWLVDTRFSAFKGRQAEDRSQLMQIR